MFFSPSYDWISNALECVNLFQDFIVYPCFTFMPSRPQNDFLSLQIVNRYLPINVFNLGADICHSSS
jgi:hypothetical protein